MMDFIDDVSPLEALILRHNKRIDAITEDACRKLDAIKPSNKDVFLGTYLGRSFVLDIFDRKEDQIELMRRIDGWGGV